MAKRREDFPDTFRRVLQSAQERGELVLTFESEEICTRERLRFYRFLASVRGDKADVLQPVAASCVVQWRSQHGSREKRILRIVAQGRASDDVWTQAAGGVVNDEVARQLDIEDALAREKALLREQFKQG
jgi:hypothetical protein